MTLASNPSTESRTATLLDVQGVTRRFGGLVAVDRVSFRVGEGEIFGLIGPNGAGKTTLFNLLTGLLSPTTGNIFFQGQAIAAMPPHRIARLGIARTFQNIRLFCHLSALENVAIAHHTRTQTGIVKGILGLPPAAAEERQTYASAMALLELVGLGDRPHERANSFAYGDQRRLEIARALALRPKLLLLDEPAAGMNPTEKGQLAEFIRHIRDRFALTIVLIEHNVPLVMGVCDRVAVLHFGRTIALGDPATVRTDPAVIEAYLGEER